MTKDFDTKEYKNCNFEVFFPQNLDSSRILVACAPSDYSASALARAVEDADAQLLNLNVTSLSPGENRLAVALRVSHRSPMAAIRSLERYGFEILDYDSPSADDDTMRSRYDELMHILSI